MMGPYYYYDTSFMEEASADLHIHDCMWSGECYSCPTRVTFSNAPAAQGPNGTAPIPIGGVGYMTLTAPHHESPKKISWVEEIKSPIKLVEKSQDLITDSSGDSSRNLTPERPVKSVSEKPTRAQSKKSTPARSTFSSTDNKKLRHREVEKNRHRQLQAMVKTLSEKIPGRLDKETQVQTMKRAARYCVYLREYINSATHGQPTLLKEKLEKIYLRSCDNVELILSQNTSA